MVRLTSWRKWYLCKKSLKEAKVLPLKMFSSREKEEGSRRREQRTDKLGQTVTPPTPRTTGQIPRANSPLPIFIIKFY